MESPNSDLSQVRKKSMPKYRKVVRGMWILLGVGILSGVLVFFLLSFSDLPSTQELEHPKNTLATEVFAEGGEVLGRYFIENRVPVKFDDLSPHLVNALIATEDERYYKHAGIDMEALGRVLVKTAVLRNRNTGGGSTITQQLAKLLFTGPRASGFERGIQKLKEWIIAVRLERRYTKEEIMAMYLNKFDFLNDGDGIKAAAEIYFGKSQDELTVEEAATLVGMLKNPSLFNPVRRPDTVRHRRMVVLSQMLKNGYISELQYDSLRQLPLDMSSFRRKTHNDGLAPYFRGELSKEVDRILDREDVRKPDGSRYNLYRDGLKIFTTIDPLVQDHMEHAVAEHMKGLQEKFDKHWKGMDPWKYKTHETTKLEMTARERKLKRMIRNSDRYQFLREQYLSNILKVLQDQFPKARLRDVDFDRMLAEEDEPGTLKELERINIIGSALRKSYEKIMRSPNWGELKKEYAKLEARAEEMFAKPVKMKVFTYENEKMEKDTVMSPLDSLIYHHHFLQIGSIAVDPVTGHVKGWIGGINYKYFKFDHVQSRRQVGSTFKPFVYAAAIQFRGISPCYKVRDLPQTIAPGDGNFFLQEPWTPSNSDGKYSGEVLTLKDGLRQSKNTVSVYLMSRLRDTEPVRDLVDKMGIDKDAKYPNGQYVVPMAPSICLGAADLGVFEMTGAYTTFANNGIYTKPRFIEKIIDGNGNVIYEGEEVFSPALEEDANHVMVEMLKYAATGMQGIKSEVGGKTGTTNDYVDGWFMGVTPNLVIGTWVGGEDRWIRFRSITYGQGAVMAKPYFKDVIKRLEADPDAEFDPNARFPRPKGDISIEMDCSLYEFAGDPNDPNGEYDQYGEEDMFADDEYPGSDTLKFNFFKEEGLENN
jgi:penicillin-binding protein 1A